MLGIVGIVGAIVASFCCVVGERFILKENFLIGRSRCNACRAPIRAVDLVPVISYIGLRGKSRCCGETIPVSYVLIELLVGVSWAVAYAKWGVGQESMAYFALTCLLAIITVTDLRAMIIPNKILGCFFLFFLLFYLSTNQLIVTRISDSLLMLSFFLIILLFQKDGIGGGDIKLFILLSFILGLYKGMIILLLSCACALVVGLIFRKKKGQPFIFGPMIALVTLGSALVETSLLKSLFPFWSF